ncbi:MAG: hypothetical protein ACP5N2_04245 [Candidatus Nanoarchaeia archaeon]
MAQEVNDKNITRGKINAQHKPELFKNILLYLKEHEVKQDGKVIVPKGFNFELSVENIFELYSKTAPDKFGHNGFVIDDYILNYKKKYGIPQEKEAELIVTYLGNLQAEITYYFKIKEDNTVKKLSSTKVKITKN